MSNWNDTKAQKELRAQLYVEAAHILKTAKTEMRDLNSDEIARHKKIMDDLSEVNLKLMEAECGDTNRRITLGDTLPNQADDHTETRALGSNESCASYLRSRGS